MKDLAEAQNHIPEVTNSHLMTPGQLAEYLQLSTRHIYRLVHWQTIPHLKIGKSVRFKRDQIDRWLQGQERQPRKRVTIRL